MGAFQGDIRLKAIVDRGLEDIKKNPWLLTDILSDCMGDPYLANLYASQIASCQQWLDNNRINIYLSQRDDKMDFPAVIIDLGEPSEKPDMKTMGDYSTETINLMPQQINKPMPFVIKPQAGSYDSVSGLYTFNPAANLTLIAKGMMLVDPSTGIGFPVLDIGPAGVSVGPSMAVTGATYGIVPQYQFYQAKVGHTFFAENFTLSCCGVDQQTTLWLHSIVSYMLLRYRASLLEAGGLAETVIKSSALMMNSDFSDNSQMIWMRQISITGQTEPTWIMAPHRFVETVNFKDPDQPEGYFGGIKILSNLADTEDLSQVNWQTVPDFMAGEGDEQGNLIICLE